MSWEAAFELVAEELQNLESPTRRRLQVRALQTSLAQATKQDVAVVHITPLVKVGATWTSVPHDIVDIVLFKTSPTSTLNLLDAGQRNSLGALHRELRQDPRCHGTGATRIRGLQRPGPGVDGLPDRGPAARARRRPAGPGSRTHRFRT